MLPLLAAWLTAQAPLAPPPRAQAHPSHANHGAAHAPAHGKKPEKKTKEPKLPKGYAASRAAWHYLTPGKTAPVDSRGVPKLVLYAINTGERVELTPRDDQGGFSAEDLEQAANLLRDPATGNRHPTEPRTLSLVYRIQRHFNAPEIRVISGYRTPSATSHSQHGRGRAIDLVVPGTKDEEVAKWVREQGFTGCGTYPLSGFVHVDVRAHSYFWEDSSAPGKKNRERGVHLDIAAKSDAAALARGDVPPPPYGVAKGLDGRLAAEAVGDDDDDHEGGPDGAMPGEEAGE